MKRGSGEASPWGKKKVSGARYSATAFLGWAVYDLYHQVLRTVYRWFCQAHFGIRTAFLRRGKEIPNKNG